MKKEELEKLKKTVKSLQDKKSEIISIREEIIALEELDDVKKYLSLLNLLSEKTSGRNSDIDSYDDRQIVNLALKQVELTPDEKIYVYLGTYKYNHETDIVHGSGDILVARTNHDADYVLYQSLETKYDETIQIPYNESNEFEATHKVIFPQDGICRQKYFYELQSEYFETMVFKSPLEAMQKINKLIKK